MKVIVIEVPELGNRSHLVHDGSVGLVVDPPRDLARIEAVAEREQVEIVAVADTHLHNDYLSGALALAERHGADYLLHADEDVDFERAASGTGMSSASGGSRSPRCGRRATRRCTRRSSPRRRVACLPCCPGEACCTARSAAPT